MQDFHEVHYIFDSYDDYGINPKQLERFARCGLNSHWVETVRTRYVRDFRKIMINNERKSSLTKFSGEYIRDNLPNSWIMGNENRKVHIAGD